MNKLFIFLICLLTLSFISAFSVDIPSYADSGNYSYTSVNNSDFWDNLDTPGDISLSDLGNLEFLNNNFNGSGTYNGLSIISGSDWIYLSGDGSIESGFDIAIPKYPNRDFYYGYGGGESHYFGNAGELTIASDGDLITSGYLSGNGSRLNTNSTTWWATVSGFVNKWFYKSGNDLTFNETQLNDSIEAKIAVTYYNASSYNIVEGTLDDGDLSSIQTYDWVMMNISESVGSPAFDLRVNFTGIEDFNELIIRMKTTDGGNHRYKIQIYNYVKGSWEDYSNFVEVDTFKVMSLGVYDSSEHISDNIVQVRIYLDESGIPSHKVYFDWIELSLGPGTFSTNEIDPLSYHKGENITTSNSIKLTNTTTTWRNYVDANGTLVWEVS